MTEQKKPRTKTRRTRSSHPGVVMVKRVNPDGEVVWRARFTDPDTGRLCFVLLDPVALPNKTERRKWAGMKAKNLAIRRMELLAGEPRRTTTPIDAALNDYLVTFAARPGSSPKTVVTYRRNVELFTAFVRARGVEFVEQVTQGHLAAFKESEIRRRKQVITKAVKRGTRVQTSEPRAAATVNCNLRAVATFLNDQRRQQRTPYLNRDVIAESLKELVTPRPRPAPLKPWECRRLLEAALAHDRATYKITRFEHAQDPSAVAVNETRRYAPIAPFVALMLLTGMRLGEALNLRWSDVHLDAKNERGEPTGQIRLEWAATKTRRARWLDLGVSPWLRSMLARMRLRAGETGFVFGGDTPMAAFRAENARRRMIRPFDAPTFDWKKLRKTCGSYLANSPGLWGAASVFRTAIQLGHSVAVSERHYLGVISGISSEAHALEDAMEIRGTLAEVLRELEGEHRLADRVSDVVELGWGDWSTHVA